MRSCVEPGVRCGFADGIALEVEKHSPLRFVGNDTFYDAFKSGSCFLNMMDTGETE